MTHAVDKVIIANTAGMNAKYGAAGLKLVDAALRRLVRADRARGLNTEIIRIDDSAQMSAFGAAPIVSASDERGAKTAVDAVFDALNPDYILLLDGPDVVPHIQLSAVAGLDDGDREIESDLPYACPTAAFARQPKSYLGVTRVVGRLPMTRGTQDAAAFAALIDRSAAHKPRPHGSAPDFFAISADVWRVSTQLSLNALFGTFTALHVSPHAGHAAIDPALGQPLHFINCHGATSDWRFYGQSGDDYPVAMESHLVAPHIAPGSVAAAECCYGAQLYDPDLLGTAPPICMSYLLNGAIAFMGSTTIAYGPAASNAQADLIAQFFLEEVMNGASTGRAMLRARQRFVQGQVMSSPTNLKTLAQFVLYGDPSLQAVLPAQEPPGHGAQKGAAAQILADDRESARKSRRVALKSDGLAFAASATFLAREVGIDGNRKAVERVEAIARKRGFTGDPAVFAISGGAAFREATKRMDRTPQIAVIVEKNARKVSKENHEEIPRYRVLVAHILGDGITAIEECESR